MKTYSSSTDFARFLTDYVMRTTGITREDYGKLCVAQRQNALSFPHALFKKPLTMQEYLEARPIAEPLHLFDCVMPCAGGEGFIVMSEERARYLSLPYARLLGTIERHNAFPEDPIQYRGGWAMDAEDLYAQAGVGPSDMDLVQVYDDYPVISAMQLEDLGFCPKGEVQAFIRANTFTNDGTLPLNTSGGQLSVGQAGAAGGYLGLVEALRQVTRRPLGEQVPEGDGVLAPARELRQMARHRIVDAQGAPLPLLRHRHRAGDLRHREPDHHRVGGHDTRRRGDHRSDDLHRYSGGDHYGGSRPGVCGYR